MNNDNPYRTPSAAVADVPEGELQLAGRGHRFGAAMIDAIIYAAMLWPVAYAAGIFSINPDSPQLQPLSNRLLMAILGFALFVLAQSYFLKRNGQTIGKKIVGIRIVDLDDKVPGLGTLLGRRYGPMYLINAVPFVGGLFALINALFIFRSDRRCIHDHIARSKVILAGPRYSSATWFLLPFLMLFGLAILAGIGAAIVIPQLERSHAPRTVPAAPKKTGAATAIPTPGPSAPDSRSPSAQSPSPPNAANEMAQPQGSGAELRSCLELKDPAAVIRCSQGRK